MKKIFLILLAFSTFTLTAQNRLSEKAQQRSHKKEMKSQMTPEQRAELHVKKMTLDLDLNKSQQEKLEKLYVSRFQNRPAGRKPSREMTSDERFEARSARLDRQIEFRDELKKILTPGQYEKWEELQKERPARNRKQMHQRRNRR